jgi:hypothetical protein
MVEEVELKRRSTKIEKRIKYTIKAILQETVQEAS